MDPRSSPSFFPPTFPHHTLDQMGESGLLPLLRRYCLPGSVGDDAAVLTIPQGRLVVSTDMLVESVHFSEVTTPPESVGWRAAAANLSDMAAMGASPVGLVVALGLPGSTPVEWIERVYSGLKDCCQLWATGCVGGDLCRADQKVVSITVFGTVAPESVMTRSQAQPGDWWVVTGPHGSSRAGLELLLHPDHVGCLTDEARQRLIAAHQYPRPRLDVLPILAELGSARIAAMDTSDGLADALIQMCHLSQVSALIEPDRIPVDPALAQGFPELSLEWAFYGGEDFELLLSLPPDQAAMLLARLPGSARIGSVVPQQSGGSRVEVQGLGILDPSQTFQHFGGGDPSCS